VVLQGTANTNDGVAYGGWVLRNVDPGAVLDATPVVTGPTTSTNPDALQITTVTPGAWVLVMAVSNNADGTPGAPSDYENAITIVGVDAVNTSIGGATRVKSTPGAENPGAFPTWDSGTWYAATLAIKPFTSTNGGTGTLTAAAGPLGGTVSNGGGGTLTAVA
jgi:hypothetical protein